MMARRFRLFGLGLVVASLLALVFTTAPVSADYPTTSLQNIVYDAYGMPVALSINGRVIPIGIVADPAWGLWCTPTGMTLTALPPSAGHMYQFTTGGAVLDCTYALATGLHG